MLDPNFQPFKAVFAALNERVDRIQFKKVTDNQAKFLTQTQRQDVEIDTEIDLMFECPGIPLSHGSQRLFTRILCKLHTKPEQKSIFVSLDSIRCSVEEISNYTPSNQMIWKSVRSVTLQRLTGEFFKKCIHNTFQLYACMDQGQ
jgi:hypothetical protein